VAGGVRPEITQIAEERREKWVKQGHAPSGASLTAQKQVFESIPSGINVTNPTSCSGGTEGKASSKMGTSKPKTILAAKN
jgi:hypothetical protein